MPFKTIQELEAYIRATAAVYNHSHAKLISRKTRVKPRRKEGFLSSLRIRKTSCYQSTKGPPKRWSKPSPSKPSHTKDVKENLQVFVRTPLSYTLRTLCFQLHPETPVSSLKEEIQKTIFVEARYQRLYDQRNFQLCDLLTLEENGVDRDEVISLHLSMDDPNDEDATKGQASVDEEYLRDLFSKTASSWKELPKHLGYEEAEIADIQSTNEGSTEESRHMLLAWWRKTTDRKEAAQKLRQALEAIGLTDLAQTVPVTSELTDEAARPKSERRQDGGVDDDSKQNEATSSEEEKPKKEELCDQDKPPLIIWHEKLQVFVRSNLPHKPRTLCLQLDSETSVLALKQIIHETLGIPPRQQRLVIKGNFELPDLLSLNDCGVRQDQNISLRLSTDGLKGGGMKDEHPHDDQFFRGLASKLLSSWRELAIALGIAEAEIKRIQTSSQDNSEQSLQMLLSWWKNQTNREEAIQSLSGALAAIGLAELALMIPSEEQQGHREKHKPEVRLGGATKHSKQKGTASKSTSSVGQRPEPEEVGCRGKPKQEDEAGRKDEAGGAKGMTSAEDQSARQVEVGPPHKFEVEVGGAQKQREERETLASERERPRREKVVPGHKSKPEVNVDVEETTGQGYQKGTKSPEGQGPSQVYDCQQSKQKTGQERGAREKENTPSLEHRSKLMEQASRDKPLLEGHIEGARDKQKEATSSEGQRQSHHEAGVTDPNIQKRVLQSTEGQRLTHLKPGDGHTGVTATDQSQIKKEEKEVRERTSQDQQLMRYPSAVQDIAPLGLQHEALSLSPAVPGRGPAHLVSVNVSGDDAPIFLGPVIQPTFVSNIPISADVGRAQSSPRDAAEQCKKELQGTYLTTGSYVQLIPWVDDDMKHIRDIYTELELDKGDQDIEGDVNGYADIFLVKQRNGKAIKHAVLRGSPGMGKSTLIDKIAYDWAEGSALQEFPLLFVLKMSALEQTSELIEAVFSQLLADDTKVDKGGLEAFIEDNGGEVVILIDGFDEFTTTELEPKNFGSILKMLNRKCGKERFVLVTTRPSHFAKLASKSLIEKPFTHVNVLGFREKHIEEYVRKFFLGEPDTAQRLLDRIRSSDVLSDLARSPMLLLLMALLWREQNTLPDTLSRLFKQAIEYIFRRKMPEITEEEISEVVIALGKTAFEGLVSPEQKLSFQEREFEKRVLDIAMQAGILTSQRIIKWLKTHNNVQFIHKTFQEFCAAMYCQSLLSQGDEEFKKNLEKLDYPRLFEYMLRFCCGDNPQCTRHVLQMLQEKGTEKDLALKCYFESQTGDLLSVDFIESFFTEDISLYNNDSVIWFIWLLQHVAEHTRALGVDYFAKVRDIELENCNLSRYSEVLASHLTKMKNLSKLKLQRCELTGSSANQMLSSLHNCNYLTEINLKNNAELGGSAKDWAVQLRGMKFLERLFLSRCGLSQGDVTDIASSVGELQHLAELKLSINCLDGLVGRAEMWAASLQKMMHLKKLGMRKCSIEGRDVKYIADSVSRMQNLVDCVFGCNWYDDKLLIVRPKADGIKVIITGLQLTVEDMADILQSFSNRRDLVSLLLGEMDCLGGSAALWAPHLQGLTHLKELSLRECSLHSTDIEHIAEVASQLPNLADLNLSRNFKFGDKAETWAASLKRMMHLNSLDLTHCCVNEHDVSHITSSVAEMPNLAELNLSGNEALGDKAETWAASLKRMMHLKSLDLSKCCINEHDVSHIASSVAEMPNLAELNLSGNRTLDGSAGTWAAGLQSMIHLQKLDMSKCGIEGRDVKYIAESVSRMQNLVDCDFSSRDFLGWKRIEKKLRVQSEADGIQLSIEMLSLTIEDIADILQIFSNRRDLVSLVLCDIDGLGGSAALWAPHLQSLTHLKELSLLRCSLQSTDIEHLAAAVRRMPTVESLSLKINPALRGSAETWAPSLKQMKHVDSLKLGWCALTEKDKIHISKARKSGIDFGSS